ncbi:DUF1284 domain-containing protein [Azospirillum thermophilum]|uniref:DUF1284 domain-containing protein n=1 Tax=Azospirillum thermophilum TaxID=2202148 RepID=A0A2S2CWZ5_9PROT|nr:DUF1284 domain-containing protein [Azospirillum thermophilum]AWK88920.1 DUF1284 domain-containing protein [Azospirillum thermophilum]
MTVRLRAHHLLCMLTYAGKGYSPAFVANYDLVVARLAGGEDILMVEGPDDLCAPLLGDPQAHCRNAGVRGRDAAAAAAVTALLARPVAAGDRLRLDAALLERLRTAFRAGTTRTACGGCEWSGLCTGIAEGGFAGTRLQI